MIRLLYAIPSWILFLIIRTILILVGYIVVPIGVLTRNYETRASKYYTRIIRAFKSPLLWLWGNEEEGIGYYGGKGWSLERRILYSECVRNPVNNLRYVPLLSVKIDVNRVGYIGNLKLIDESLDELRKYDDDAYDFLCFTWCGFYSNIRYQGKIFGKRRRIWIGWKIYPEDIYGVSPTSHRYVSAGFATQFKVIGD